MRTARTDSMWNLARVLGSITALLLVIIITPNARGAECLEVDSGKVWEDIFPFFVNIYTGTHFGGTCRSFPIGFTIPDLRKTPVGVTIPPVTGPDQDLDNMIRSIKIGHRVRLRLFAGTDFSGDWDWWETSRESLDRWAWNARASSLRVEDRDIRLDCSNLKSNTVAIYENSDFRGDCRVLSPGCYDGAKEMGFENDSLSSIRNRAGEVTLYRHARFRSPLPPPDSKHCYWPFPCVDYEGFPTIEPGEDWSYIGDDLNDATTSICIRNRE